MKNENIERNKILRNLIIKFNETIKDKDSLLEEGKHYKFNKTFFFIYDWCITTIELRDELISFLKSNLKKIDWVMHSDCYKKLYIAYYVYKKPTVEEQQEINKEEAQYYLKQNNITEGHKLYKELVELFTVNTYSPDAIELIAENNYLIDGIKMILEKNYKNNISLDIDIRDKEPNLYKVYIEHNKDKEIYFLGTESNNISYTKS